MVSRKRKKPSLAFIFVCSKINSYEISINSGINYEINDPRLADDNSSVFSFYSHIELFGEILDPEGRLGNILQLSIYGRDQNDGLFDSKLGDYQVRGEYGQLKYKKRGNKEVPVYNPPDSIGFIQRNRGTKTWVGAVWLPSDIVNSMITLLGTNENLYISISEVKSDRRRYITNLSLKNHESE